MRRSKINPDVAGRVPERERTGATVSVPVETLEDLHALLVPLYRAMTGRGRQGKDRDAVAIEPGQVGALIADLETAMREVSRV